MQNEVKVKRKLVQLNAIHHNVTTSSYKSFRDLNKDVKVDSRLLSYLNKNEILAKKNNKIVWNNSIKPNPALARTYQNYIDQVNKYHRKSRKKSNEKVQVLGSNQDKKSFSVFWGLIKFNY
jgi:hypothetical protein